MRDRQKIVDVYGRTYPMFHPRVFVKVEYL
jgi:hypothetical protein